jgi:hypothetical protein
MTRDKPHVLVGFAEALAAPEVVWSLLSAGLHVSCVTRRRQRPLVRRIRGVKVHEVTAPESDLRRAGSELRSLVARAGVSAFMPIDDAGLHMVEFAELERETLIAGPTGERLTLALDKRRQISLAHEAGFLVPETRAVESAQQAVDTAAFPCVLKSALASQVDGGQLVRGGVAFCADRTELESNLRSGRVLAPLLIQEVMTGVGVGIEGVSHEEGSATLSAHRRIRMMNPHGSGSSACRSVPLSADLAEPTRRLLDLSGWRGLFMIELLCDERGTAWFVELNGRAWGSMALTRRLGLELPALALAEALGAPPPAAAQPSTQTLVCRHAGRELAHLLFVMRGPKSAALPAWPSRWRTALDVLRIRPADSWYNREPGYGGLFVEDTVRTVAATLARAL